MRAPENHNTTRNDQSLVSREVPAAAPAWVTRDLIKETLDTFESYYDEALTADDALEILINTVNLFDQLES